MRIPPRGLHKCTCRDYAIELASVTIAPPQVWELGTGELKDTLIGHTSHVVGVAFTPDGKKLLSAGWDETIKVGKERNA